MTELAARPERYPDHTADSSAFGIVEKPLSTWERIFNQGAVRKTLLLLVLALAWELYARWLNNPLLFPTFSSMLEAFAEALRSGVLPSRACNPVTCSSSATVTAFPVCRCARWLPAWRWIRVRACT